MKLSPNAPCPCGSGTKYKKCCQPYHKGARAPDALTLMRSRYSAYAAGQSRYILRTTHPNNPDHTDDTAAWQASIDAWCAATEFRRLEILEYTDGEKEAFVTFRATFGNGEMVERSRFLKEGDEWFYVDGEFGDAEH
jgi:SEC-C motif-containing protein